MSGGDSWMGTVVYVIIHIMAYMFMSENNL